MDPTLSVLVLGELLLAAALLLDTLSQRLRDRRFADFVEVQSEINKNLLARIEALEARKDAS